MGDPFAIDINIVEGGRRVHEDKLFSGDDSDTLEEATQDAVKLHARAMVLEDDSNDKDIIFHAIISRITSITCVGKPSRNLLKYLDFNTFPLRGLDSASTPILENGLNVKFTLPEKNPPVKPTRVGIDPMLVFVHLEWLIELRLLYKLVEFIGQDDKAEIP